VAELLLLFVFSLCVLGYLYLLNIVTSTTDFEGEEKNGGNEKNKSKGEEEK